MLGHDVGHALPELRRQADSTLRDVCDLQSRTGSTVDATTGARIDAWTTYAAAVPCRVRTTLGETVTEAGGSQITAQRMTCAVSASRTGVEVGHRLVITASEDASMVGRELYVRATPRGTDMVLRRLTVTDVQEWTDVDPVR